MAASERTGGSSMLQATIGSPQQRYNFRHKRKESSLDEGAFPRLTSALSPHPFALTANVFREVPPKLFFFFSCRCYFQGEVKFHVARTRGVLRGLKPLRHAHTPIDARTHPLIMPHDAFATLRRHGGWDR